MAIVTITGESPSIDADATPQFIIQIDGIYYLTQAVWIYDINNAMANKDQDQIDGCNLVNNVFLSLQPSTYQVAVWKAESDVPSQITPRNSSTG